MENKEHKKYVITQERLDSLSTFIQKFQMHQRNLFNIGMGDSWNSTEKGFALGNTFVQLRREFIQIDLLLKSIKSTQNRFYSGISYQITQKEFEEFQHLALQFKKHADDIECIWLGNISNMRKGYNLGRIHTELLYNSTDMAILISTIKKSI